MPEIAVRQPVDFWTNDVWGDLEDQKPGGIIDCSNWRLHSDEPVYQEGAREKVLLVSPQSPANGFVQPSHPYLFKLSDRRYPCQYWNEIIAYRLGRLVDVPAPPAYVALRDDVPGALIEWFYPDPADWGRIDFTLGGELLLGRDKDFDRAKGMAMGHCHALDAVEDVLDGVVGWRQALFRMLAFDVLIANGDRHHDNWGVWRHLGRDGHAGDRFLSPAFDNGSSLGHERQEEKLPVLLKNQDWFTKHTFGGKARHHLRLASGDSKGGKLTEVILAVAANDSQILGRIGSILSVSSCKMKEVLDTLGQFVVPAALSRDRQRFVMRILATRQQLLGELLDEHGA